MGLGVFLPLQFFGIVSEGEVLTFFKCLIEFACEAIWSWTFVCWKIFNHSFNFSTCDWSVHIFFLIFIYLFIFDCVGSSFLCEGFL